MRQASYDTGQVPAPHQLDTLFLSAYFERGQDLITWTDVRHPFALRVMFFVHDPSEFWIVMQFIGEREEATPDLVPSVPAEIPPGLEPMVKSLFRSMAVPLKTNFDEIDFLEHYEAEEHLWPSKARLMTRDGQMLRGGVREITISAGVGTEIFPLLSNHQMLGLSDHPEIEFYRHPGAR